jgi:transposase-like protein
VHAWLARKKTGTLRRSRKRRTRYTPEQKRTACDAVLRSGRSGGVRGAVGRVGVAEALRVRRREGPELELANAGTGEVVVGCTEDYLPKITPEDEGLARKLDKYGYLGE